jgi:hypothetical protein
VTQHRRRQYSMQQTLLSSIHSVCQACLCQVCCSFTGSIYSRTVFGTSNSAYCAQPYHVLFSLKLSQYCRFLLSSVILRAMDGTLMSRQGASTVFRHLWSSTTLCRTGFVVVFGDSRRLGNSFCVTSIALPDDPQRIDVFLNQLGC